MHIGHITLANRLFAAPMAGVTDRPFRQLCKRLGAGYAVSEMVTSRKDLWNSLKTSRRADHDGETAPIAVQIAGTDAAMMAEAAAYNVDRGAQIIDINMGCPAKKVCNKWAGSALMQDEPLALEIVEAVVAACAPHGVPVTLKMRTGWCADRDATRCASRAPPSRPASRMVDGARPHARAGLQGPGRVRHRRGGEGGAAHPGGRQRRHRLAARRRATVLAATGADAIMIGRAAQGRPWIFREIAHFLATGEHAARRRGSPRSRPGCSITCDDHYAPVRRVRRRAQRAQAHRLDAARPARRRRIPRRDEHDRDAARRSSRAVADWFDALADSAPLLPAATRGRQRDHDDDNRQEHRGAT